VFATPGEDWRSSVNAARRLSRLSNDVKMTFEESAETIPAARAAGSLVRTMGNAFEDEMDRTMAFNRCIGPVFASADWRTQVLVNPTSEQCSGHIDAAFQLDDSMVAAILREDKK